MFLDWTIIQIMTEYVLLKETARMWKSRVEYGITEWIRLARDGVGDRSLLPELERLREDAGEGITLLIAGEFKSGKSTFINALIGEEVLTADVTPATAVVTKLTYGQERRVIGHFHDGRVSEFAEQELKRLSSEQKGDGEALRKELFYIELQLPIELLKTVHIVDSPGLNSGYDHHTKATQLFIDRADVAVWLFNYQNIGTASELDMIRTIKGKGIELTGIVNRVDLHDESEDGELEDLLDYNIRRMPGLFTKLYGVSAKLALEGKRERNPQKLEWAQWNEMDRFLEEVRGKEKVKKERIFFKLQELLRRMDSFLLDAKMALPVPQHDILMNSFTEKAYPKLDSMRARIAERHPLLLAEANEWRQLYAGTLVSSEHVEDLMRRYEELERRSVLKADSQLHTEKPLMSIWREEVLPPYGSYVEEARQLVQKAEEIRLIRDKRVSEWSALLRKRWLKKAGLRSFGPKLDNYHTLLEALRVEKQGAESRKDTAAKALERLAQELKQSITRKLQAIRSEVDGQAKEWQREYDEAKKTYAELKPRSLAVIGSFYQGVSKFLEGMDPIYYMDDLEAAQLRAFQQCKFHIGNIRALYRDLPAEKVRLELERFLAYPPVRPADFEATTGGKILVFSVLDIPVPELPAPLEFDVEDELEEIGRHRRRIAYAWLISAGMLAALFFGGRAALESHRQNLLKEAQEEEEARIRFEQMSSSNTGSQGSSYRTTSTVEQETVTTEEQIRDFISGLYNRTLTLSAAGEITEINRLFQGAAWPRYRDYIAGAAGGSLTAEVTDITEDNRDSAGTLVETREVIETDQYRRVFHNTYSIRKSGGGWRIYTFRSQVIEEEEKKSEAVAEAEVLAALNTFRGQYMEALNQRRFELIRPLLATNGPVYKELYDYIQSLPQNGYRFDFLENQVTSVSQTGPNDYEARVEESFIYTDGEGYRIRYDRSKLYKLSTVSGEIRIVQIDILDTKKEELGLVDSTAEAQAATAEAAGEAVTVTPAVEQSAAAFMERYYADFEAAFNGNGFQQVEGYYNPNGREYANEKAYLEFAVGKSMRMANEAFQVKKVASPAEGVLLVDIELVDRYEYQDGTGDVKRVAVQYALNVTPSGGLNIQDISSLTILDKQEFTWKGIDGL